VTVETFDVILAAFLQADVFYALSYPPKVGETPRELRVKTVRGSEIRAIVAFEGIETREAADEIRGTALAKRSFLPMPTPAFYLDDDLTGLVAVNTVGARLGTIVGTAFNGAQNMLDIKTDAGHRFYVPMVDTYVKALDFAADRVTLDWDLSWL
ncbi:MAG TPA: hypothetical protein DCW60_00210, partial [Sutterella sp.]|nr:hypothetical protein [Sutterella sp.]